MQLWKGPGLPASSPYMWTHSDYQMIIQYACMAYTTNHGDLMKKESAVQPFASLLLRKIEGLQASNVNINSACMQCAPMCLGAPATACLSKQVCKGHQLHHAQIFMLDRHGNMHLHGDCYCGWYPGEHFLQTNSQVLVGRPTDLHCYT